MPQSQRVIIRVPATTANLGPGFDCLGMAFDLWNELTVEAGEFSIHLKGEGAGASSLPLDSNNLIVAGLEAAFRSLNQSPPDLTYTCVNKIPYARGFGSSSAGIVSGLLAGFAIAGTDADDLKILNLAADLDGHSDNVAPALAGGCCVSIRAASGWIADRVPLPENLKIVFFIPEIEGITQDARSLLPDVVTRTDAVFNIGRSAMLVNALSNGRLDLLRDATDDRLHQESRGSLFPAAPSIIKASMVAGAHGAFLSGAGPSIAALVTEHEMTVSYEMAEAARLHNLSGRVIVKSPTQHGAYVVSKQ